MMARTRQSRPVAVDFETHGIERRPRYPPIPVGVSVKFPGRKARYLAWGHIEGNNCSWDTARAVLVDAWNHDDGVVFQNAKFDLDVAETHMGMWKLPWDKVHDTMFLLFLDDPHQAELSLKPSAERLLGIPPEEQDAVGEWLIRRQPIPGVKISRSKQSPHYFGKYIAYAPASVVGLYANGDVDRTLALFDLLWPRIVDAGMLGAYDREREVMPVLLDMERTGIAFDLVRARSDLGQYKVAAARVDAWIIRKLRASPGINLDSGDQVMAALLRAGLADAGLALRTKSDKLSTSKESLLLAVTDKVLLAVLRYRAALKTCLGTFMEPWVAEAMRTGGTISTNWNQVKSPAGDSSVGTRTGRLSASRFMNMPKEFTAIFKEDTGDTALKKKLPARPPGLKDLQVLPLLRSYIIPFPGEVLIDRDYSQQEPRILAHFDGGALMDKYVEDPWIDFHDYAQIELRAYGLYYDRKPVKNTNLGLMYGMGAPKLAAKNDMSVEEAKKLKNAILKLYPGLAAMYRDMKQRAIAHEPVRTWGGRVYYCEPPAIVNRKLMHFDYKLVNVLIQGSAADCTKEALLRWSRYVKQHGKTAWKLILLVHDQLTASVPRKDVHDAMEVLRQCMESVEFDVQMLTEGSTSSQNWSALIDYDKKGKRV